MAKLARKYIKLSVPVADTSVMAWLERQDDMSASIRFLIRNEIERNGLEDVFCREVIPQSKKGRPSNAELQYRAEQEQEHEEHDDAVKSDVKQSSSQANVRSVVQKEVLKKDEKRDVALDADGNVDPEALLNFL